jgi:hypothetical protein
MPGNYCGHCGEKRVHPDDLSLAHFSEHVLEAFTHVDGKLGATLRALLREPGRLSADYLLGKRRPYLGPVQLFLICNLIFFLALPIIQWDVFTTPLNSQVKGQFYSAQAQALVDNRLAARQLTFAANATRFNQRAEIIAHSLLILLAPLFSIPMFLINWRRRYLECLLFALHFCAFWLLLTMASLGMINLVLAVVRAGGGWIADTIIQGLAVLLVCLPAAVYLTIALKRTFGGSMAVNMLKALLLAAILFPIIQAYRGILFLVAFATT